MTNQFPCYLVRKNETGRVETTVGTAHREDLPPGDVLVHVEYSSLNYKDALAARGHPGVVQSFPHVPGIDAAGVVEVSDSDEFHVGDEVLITGYGLGASRWGGYAGFVRMPAEYVVPLPAGLTLCESMILGTAGFTAAQLVGAILDRAIDTARGPVVVTGASGGVGCISVALLAKLGFEVVAVSRKQSAHDFLRDLGASKIIGREDVVDTSDRPLLSARWSAGVDTVGGTTLATLLRSTMHRGCVAACGLVGGHELSLTVYPFILRGVTLAGIDSEKCPMPERRQIWSKLAGQWRLPDLSTLVDSTVNLSHLDDRIAAILAGRIQGRTLVLPEVD